VQEIMELLIKNVSKSDPLTAREAQILKAEKV
jgi:hypothetical protein